MIARISTYLLVAAAAFLGGCASIVNGHNQALSVETRAASGPITGASCKLSNNKGTWFVTTPGSTTVQRSFEDMLVRCDKESHEPGIAAVKSSTKAMAFGNIIFGGVIGAGVDIATGAAYDYPSLITVEMGKNAIIQAPAPAASTAQTGRSATVAADAPPAPATQATGVRQ